MLWTGPPNARYWHRGGGERRARPATAARLPAGRLPDRTRTGGSGRAHLPTVRGARGQRGLRRTRGLVRISRQLARAGGRLRGRADLIPGSASGPGARRDGRARSHETVEDHPGPGVHPLVRGQGRPRDRVADVRLARAGAASPRYELAGGRPWLQLDVAVSDADLDVVAARELPRDPVRDRD